MKKLESINILGSKSNTEYLQKNKYGISLIVLVITIAVIVILAGTMVFSLYNTNVIIRAKEAAFKSDVSVFKEELEMYNISKIGKTGGKYDSTLLNADKVSATYEDKLIDGISNMKDIILSINDKYMSILLIKEGELVYTGDNKDEMKWAKDLNLDTIYAEPIVQFLGPVPDEVKSGNFVTYEITVSSNFKLEYVNFSQNISLVKKIGETKTLVKNIEDTSIEEIENSEKVKKVKVTVDTTGLENGNYLLQLKEKVAKDIIGMENETKKESNMFSVKTIIYEEITFNKSTDAWTNNNIEVEIIYPEGITKKEYKLNAGDNFSTYTGKILVDKNLTIYAKGEDYLENTTSIATVTVSNIDKILPTVLIAETSKTTSSVTVSAAASDLGGSNLNTSSYEYSKDNGLTWIPGGSSATYTFTGLTGGTYNFRARVKDNAGNVGVSTVLTVELKSIEIINITTTRNECESIAKSKANTAASSAYSNCTNSGGTSEQCSLAASTAYNGVLNSEFSNCYNGEPEIDLVPNTNLSKSTLKVKFTNRMSEYKYRLSSSGSWQNYEGPLEFSSNLYMDIQYKQEKYDKTIEIITKKYNDSTPPSISFSPNGGKVSSISTRISVSDGYNGDGSNEIRGIDPDSLYYSWSSSGSVVPTSGWTKFSNSQTVTYPSSLTPGASYYLWVKANDKAMNKIVKSSSAFIIKTQYENCIDNPPNDVKTSCNASASACSSNAPDPSVCGNVYSSCVSSNCKNLYP